MIKRSPLYPVHLEMGAPFETCGDWEIAERFGDCRLEYDAVRNAAAVFDLSYAGKLRVTGRDRVRYLHNMVSNDVKGLKPGSGCYAALLTHQGRMESDLYLYASGDSFWLEVSPKGANRALETLNKYLVADDVLIEDCTAAYSILSLQGPEARGLMERTLAIDLDGIESLAHRSFARGSGEWVAVRRDRTGCDGFDLWLPAPDATDVWHLWVEMERVRPAGHRALDWLRTEAGIPWYGIDMDEKSLPMEMGLASAISLNKGCYRGQEIVARIHYRGNLDRRLGAVVIRSGEPPVKGSGIWFEDSKVGEVTSSIPSPRLGLPLALGIMKTHVLIPGTVVQVSSGAVLHPGEVVSLPIP